jgi:raffinose/stachyose/melibiose transport system substrate-binding protein
MSARTKIRAVTTALAAVALVASLAACSGGSNSASGSCNLTFLGGADVPKAQQAGYEAAFADYKKAYHCTVTARWEGSWSTIEKQLSTAKLSGDDINMFIGGTATSDLARSGTLMDLTKCIAPFKNRFAAGALEPYTIGGHNWAAPLSSTDTAAVFYNKTMFDQLGLTVPTTFAELEADGQKIAAAKGISPMIQQGKAPWYWPMWYMATLGQTTDNKAVQTTESFLKGDTKFTSAQSVKALQLLKQFTSSKLLGTDSLSTDTPGMEATFLQQKAAMFYALSPELTVLEASKPTFDIGVFKFPVMVDGATSVGGGAPENGLSIPAFADKDQMTQSCQLLEFLTRPAEAAKVLKPQDPLIPSIKSVAGDSSPIAAQLRSQFLPTTFQFLDWIWPADVDDAVETNIVNLMYNGESAESAAKAIQASYDKDVSSNGYTYQWWKKWTSSQWSAVSLPSPLKIDVKN